jgi:hypothetical protein
MELTKDVRSKPDQPSQSSAEIQELLQSVAELPGVQDLMALYQRYQEIDAVFQPAKRALQMQRISCVSDGSYPTLTR